MSLEMQNENWIAKNWRPTAAFVYLFICIFDFVIAPMLWAVLQAVYQQTLVQWSPLTLVGAGVFHMSMGAILGVSAWTRGKEKIAIAQAEYGNYNTPDHGVYYDPTDYQNTR